MTVTVITDSAAALPRDLAESVDVAVVPMRFTVGGRPYRDGELSLAEIVARAAEGITTSSPPPGEVLDAIQARKPQDGAIVLTLSSTMSSTYDVARLAARQTDLDVRVVDTGTAAGAQALVVLAAARCAQAGATLDEVQAVAVRTASRVRLMARVPSLDWLARGGRVPTVAAWAGRSVGLCFLLELRGGKARPLRPAFSDGAAFRRMLSAWRTSRPGTAAGLHVAAMHALAPQHAEQLLAAVRAEVEPVTALVLEFSPTMVAHTGPDLVGLSWWWDDAEA